MNIVGHAQYCCAITTFKYYKML